MRVLDATGKVIASDKAVIASTGVYGPIALTGDGPFRVEACGTAGDRWMCVWGASPKGGTLNLTPLSSAIAVLASGQSPETLMTGPVQGLSEAAIASAQAQVRTAIAPAMADAGLASTFDLLTGTLKPGTHTDYDRVLDTVDVDLGFDTKAFVTLGSRLGTGWAYLEPGTTQGSLAFDAAAATVDPAGIDTLFTKMNTAMANTGSCNGTLLEAQLDTNVHVTLDPTSAILVGPSLARQAICGRLAGTFGSGGDMFGGKLLPSTLGRCDFGAGDPTCRVNFVFETKTTGLLRTLGVDQVAVKRPTGWTFLGNRLEVQATATARLVLSRRVNATTPDTYARYLDIAIPAISVAVAGSPTPVALQCARVSQKDAAGADVPLALYKKAGGGYLSLWSVSAGNAAPSLDPASGATRGNDIVSLPVPSSAAGDATARNFIRAGRTLKVELFKDSACTSPLGGADGASASVDVSGLLPLAASSHSGQPWPALATTAASDLAALKGAAGAAISYKPAWTFPRGGITVNRAQLCTDAGCAAKLADTELGSHISTAIKTPATTTTLSATLGGTALSDSGYKLLRLTGRTQSGLVLQLDTQSCAAQPDGQPC